MTGNRGENADGFPDVSCTSVRQDDEAHIFSSLLLSPNRGREVKTVLGFANEQYADNCFP